MMIRIGDRSPSSPSLSTTTLLTNLSAQLLLLLLIVLINAPATVLLSESTSTSNSNANPNSSPAAVAVSASAPAATIIEHRVDGQPPFKTKFLVNGKNLTFAEFQVEEQLGLVLTPSDTCRVAAEKFGEAVSNFTLCSVTNARPIHLCGLCVQQYLNVSARHKDFIETIDEHGTECSEYYLNLDRIEIVSAAYHYVKSLWKKGNCDNCFEKNSAGQLIPIQTNDTQRFEIAFDIVRDCFDSFSNESCTECQDYYKEMNQIYVIIGDICDGNICLDIVDTMNTTREMWSGIYHCRPVRRLDFGIIFGISFVGLIPIIFYPMAFILSQKQEAKLVQQKRLAGVFGITSSQSTSIDVIGRSGGGGSTEAVFTQTQIFPEVHAPTSSSSVGSTASKRRASVVF